METTELFIVRRPDGRYAIDIGEPGPGKIMHSETHPSKRHAMIEKDRIRINNPWLKIKNGGDTHGRKQEL